MKDDFARQAATDGDDADIRAVLDHVCELTGMGFAAVARVTDTRWVACQVADRIAFGLNPGDELDIKTTICDEIRLRGDAIVIDHVSTNIDWQTHHTPALYGFESYASFPVHLADGSFYGTLCAIDPEPRQISGDAVVSVMERLAGKVAAILSAKDGQSATHKTAG